MSANTPPARRGRPVALDAEDRRDRILDAMQTVFDRQGMSGVTMASVATEAGMSKRTLYAVFEDRADLLEAYTVRHITRSIRPLSDEDRALPLADRLRRLLAPSQTTRSLALPFAILRTIIAEAPERPDMARRIFRRGIPAVREAIKAELDAANERGETDIADTEQAAALLADMARPSPLDRLIEPDHAPDDGAVEARFELGLRVFLAGIGVDRRD